MRLRRWLDIGKKYTYEIGKVYGIRKLLRIYKNEDNIQMAETECILCGDIKHCKAYEIFNDKHNSCICQLRTHNLSKTRIYAIYANMKYRCFNQNANEYYNYGGKGIKIYQDWLGENGFVNFYNWAMSHGYKENLTIDRIDENKDYEPDNCQWLTKSDNTVKANKTCQHRRANKGVYYGIDPDGNIYNFENANKFAKEHNLIPGCVRQVANYQKKSHKGWKFGFISEESQYEI